MIFDMVFCKNFIFNKSQFINVGTENFLFLQFDTSLFDDFSFISIKKTFEPCSQKCSTIEAPIPEPPPVMKTFLSFK